MFQSHRHPKQAISNPIVSSSDAPASAQWHSENEAVQARTAALVACGDGEDLAVAGISTSRGEGIHPYFTWRPTDAELDAVSSEHIG